MSGITGFDLRIRADYRARVEATVRAAAARGLSDAAEELLTVATRTAPHAEGTLQRSGTVSVDAPTLRAAVAYDTPYAVRQHEDTSLRHPDPHNPLSSSGRRAKWLQLALQENSRRLTGHVQAAIRDATGGV